ncbi:hypothetical protein GCM10023331_26980 [Algivirga pacifica]|uniref:Uncharacterized protein n=2 Tax=Algivirga pacifica TaxID=1162670 RepID=A0ABP9DCU6_9BACT
MEWYMVTTFIGDKEDKLKRQLDNISKLDFAGRLHVHLFLPEGHTFNHEMIHNRLDCYIEEIPGPYCQRHMDHKLMSYVYQASLRHCKDVLAHPTHWVFLKEGVFLRRDYLKRTAFYTGVHHMIQGIVRKLYHGALWRSLLELFDVYEQRLSHCQEEIVFDQASIKWQGEIVDKRLLDNYFLTTESFSKVLVYKGVLDAIAYKDANATDKNLLERVLRLLTVRPPSIVSISAPILFLGITIASIMEYLLFNSGIYLLSLVMFVVLLGGMTLLWDMPARYVRLLKLIYQLPVAFMEYLYGITIHLLVIKLQQYLKTKQNVTQ